MTRPSSRSVSSISWRSARSVSMYSMTWSHMVVTTSSNRRNSVCICSSMPVGAGAGVSTASTVSTVSTAGSSATASTAGSSTTSASGAASKRSASASAASTRARACDRLLRQPRIRRGSYDEYGQSTRMPERPRAGPPIPGVSAGRERRGRLRSPSPRRSVPGRSARRAGPRPGTGPRSVPYRRARSRRARRRHCSTSAARR